MRGMSRPCHGASSGWLGAGMAHQARDGSHTKSSCVIWAAMKTAMRAAIKLGRIVGSPLKRFAARRAVVVIVSARRWITHGESSCTGVVHRGWCGRPSPRGCALRRAFAAARWSGDKLRSFVRSSIVPLIARPPHFDCAPPRRRAGCGLRRGRCWLRYAPWSSAA